MGAFDKFKAEAWPYRYRAQLIVWDIHGGVPNDPKAVRGWIASKIQTTDDRLRELVATTMVERGVSSEEARDIVTETLKVNGFKRDDQGLYIEGRQIKAAIKEAASVAGAAGKLDLKKWGKTGKALIGFVAEHIQVDEDRIYLGTQEPDGVDQQFVAPHYPTYQSSIKYEEYVSEAKIEFHVSTDWEFSDREWAMIWLTGQLQGLGTSRSQSRGRYEVATWERA